MFDQDSLAQDSQLRFRLSLIHVGFVCFFVVIVARAYHLQILGSVELNRLASVQYRTRIIDGPQRGTIYDRNGHVLAIDTVVASIGVHPLQIKDREQARQRLMSIKDLDRTDIERILKSTRKYEWLQRRIPVERAQAIMDTGVEGMDLVTESRRFYPNGDVAGQLLGAVGYDSKALSGVELTYDDVLRKNASKRSGLRDARGRYIVPIEQKNGLIDLHLTIDRTIQHLTEQELSTVGRYHNAKSGFAYVMDATSGDILAMANYPSFDPNRYWEYDQSVWKNQAVSMIFEPGSTFKTFAVTAALQSQKAKVSDRIFCENGSYRVGSNIISDTHKYGWLTVGEILQVSSNIGVTKLTQKMSKQNYYDFIASFGFGQKRELGLVGETHGQLRHFKSWREIEYSNITFGQGLSVNGLEMTAAYAALVNQGKYQSPVLLDKMTDRTGRTLYAGARPAAQKLIDADVAESVKHVLHTVTQTGGTAPHAAVQDYESGGKTGTAQKFDNEKKQYAEHEYISSFIGFAPLNQPRYVIYVVLDTPQRNGYYGGVVAAPAFRKIAERVLGYESQVHPDQKLALNEIRMLTPDHDEQARLANLKMAQSMLDQHMMPQLTGLTALEVMELFSGQPQPLEIQGAGVVTKQQPALGRPLNQTETVQVSLSSAI